MDFRKTFYILPNLFTLSSVLCGFAALTYTASDRDESDLYLAALAICFGFFFDTFDGRVARLTRTQTDLGRDLDSLADLITFGAAPALMMYKWGLTRFGKLGVFVAGLFVCAGALRLARFNVLARREGEHERNKGPGKYTLGLPIPPSASVLVLMVIVSHNAGQYRAVSETSTAAVVIVLSVLMVSRVRFRSFKDLRLTRRTVGVLLLLAGAFVATVRAGIEKSFVFLVLVSAYIGLGLAEEVVFFRSRRAERLVAKRTKAQSDHADREAEDAVLRELGAFEPHGGEASPNDASKDPLGRPA